MELNFDLKSKIEEAVKKLQSDPALLQKFQKDPIKAIETLFGVDLPDEQLKPLVAGIQAKLAASDIDSKLEGLKNLF
ncbi:MAG: hypothetical protein HFJ86_11705 [Oscillospiraceae bacterium]|jgi:hypothetical protein|nr:hypothetical protein [Oscillospiraceae bacterium]